MSRSRSTAHNDLSNGWDQVAPLFIQERQKSTIGVAEVSQWAMTLPSGGNVLDLGCGFGVPLSSALIQQGLTVYGIDASPALIAEFTRRFPHTTARCEAVESSDFYGKTFDGIMAVGLVFLLPPHTQLSLIEKVARSLKPCGKFLFTAPYQVCTWRDLSTGRESSSLGKNAYLNALHENDFSLIAEFSDTGENHYFSAIKR